MMDMESRKTYQLTPVGAVVELSSPAMASPPGTAAEVCELPPGLIDILRTV